MCKEDYAIINEHLTHKQLSDILYDTITSYELKLRQQEVTIIKLNATISSLKTSNKVHKLTIKELKHQARTQRSVHTNCIAKFPIGNLGCIEIT